MLEVETIAGSVLIPSILQCSSSWESRCTRSSLWSRSKRRLGTPTPVTVVPKHETIARHDNQHPAVAACGVSWCKHTHWHTTNSRVVHTEHGIPNRKLQVRI